MTDSPSNAVETEILEWGLLTKVTGRRNSEMKRKQIKSILLFGCLVLAMVILGWDHLCYFFKYLEVFKSENRIRQVGNAPAVTCDNAHSFSCDMGVNRQLSINIGQVESDWNQIGFFLVNGENAPVELKIARQDQGVDIDLMNANVFPKQMAFICLAVTKASKDEDEFARHFGFVDTKSGNIMFKGCVRGCFR